jgi:hypothetical protein
MRMERTAVEILGGSFGLVLRAPRPGGPVGAVDLWRIRGGRWASVPEPPGRVCATSDHLISIRSSDPGPVIDPGRLVDVSTEAWVLDDGGTHWDGPTVGPKVRGAAGVGLIGGGCTSSRAAFVPATQGAATGIVFDPVRVAWRTIDLPAGAGTRTWQAWSSSDALVSVGPPGGSMHVIDAPTGARTSQPRPDLHDGGLVAAIGRRRLVVISPGDPEPVHLIDLEGR